MFRRCGYRSFQNEAKLFDWLKLTSVSKLTNRMASFRCRECTVQTVWHVSKFSPTVIGFQKQVHLITIWLTFLIKSRPYLFITKLPWVKKIYQLDTRKLLAFCLKYFSALLVSNRSINKTVRLTSMRNLTSFFEPNVVSLRNQDEGWQNLSICLSFYMEVCRSI